MFRENITMKIQHNQSLFVQNRYNHTTTELNKTLNKLSSGYKVNQAADDAAGLSISEKMRAQIRGLEQAGLNIQNSLSLLQTADGGLGSINDPHLMRMRELAIQAANDTLIPSDREKVQLEIDQLKRSIDDIADGTEFNTIKVLRPEFELPPANPTGVVDLVFVLDNTGSMSSKQQNVAANMEKLINSIKGKGVSDIRIGVLSYYDNTYTKSEFNANLWTTDIKEVVNEINAISQTNKGATENNMQAIKEVVDNYDFRDFDNSTTKYKHLILLTDEYGDDNGRASEISNLLNANGITLHTVMNNAPGLSQVVKNTGGSSVPLGYNNDWGNQLSNRIGEAIAEASGTVSEDDLMQPLILHIGANEGQNVQINLYDCRSKKIGVNQVSVLTREEAEHALGEIDAAMAKVSNYRSEYGAMSNRLAHSYQNVMNGAEQLTAAESQLRDADIARVSADLSKHQVLLQSAQAMMAQVNQMSQGILQILQ